MSLEFITQVSVLQKSLIKNIFDFYFWDISKKEMQDLLLRFPGKTPETIFEIAKAYKGAGWYKRLRHLQIISEFSDLVRLISTYSPEITFEIGSFSGFTLLAWAKITKDIVVSIDVNESHAATRQKLFKIFNYPSGKPQIESFVSGSHNPQTFINVQKLLIGKKIDFLFIDGDHRYEGVKKDFEIWSQLVKSGGLIVFHDILDNRENPDYGVPMLWREIKQKFEVSEIIADVNQSGFGIGVLHWK